MRLTLLIFVFSFFTGVCQVKENAKSIIEKLSGEEYWGRGYAKNGMGLAARFLESEFKSYGLKPLSGKKYFQEFSYPIYTFPGKMEVTLNGTRLAPGRDFIIMGLGNGKIISEELIQIDSIYFSDKENKISVGLHHKLTWTTLTTEAHYTFIHVNKATFKEVPQKITYSFESKFIPKFRANNVCGLIKGTDKPDSLIVITAHYDHLGGMGDQTFFPGANDNASGVALLLSLAKYYAQNPQPYSIAFICFAGEEAGLIGSKYFVEHSLIPLNKIRFLVNLDMVGTGDDGIAVVNSSIFKKEFDWINEINADKNYLVKIKARGKANNSDHYWFTEKGVPSFFIYAMGGIQAYHDIYDKAETLPLTEFEDIYHLIIDFNSRLMGKR